MLNVPYFYTVLADVCAHLGYPAAGLQALAEAHTLMEQYEERWWEAEIYRLRGVLLLRQPETTQAEAEPWLHRALTSPAARRRNRWSSGLPPASLVSGSSRANARKPRTCWHQSITGSPRDLTRLT